MKHLFAVLLIFILVMCFFFVPYGLAKAQGDKSFVPPSASMALYPSNVEGNLNLLDNSPIAPLQSRVAKVYDLSILALAIQPAYNMEPSRSFHVGKLT